MRVAEEHPFISYFIKLTFINSGDGKNVILDVDSSMEVDRVKMQVVSHFQGSDDCLKKSLYFTLVSIRTSDTLPDKTRLCDIGLTNGDEILLLPKRLDVPDIKDSFMKKKEESGPDLKAIASATKHLPAQNTERSKPAEKSQPDFSKHPDVLVTLIDLAHKLLCMNSETSKLFEETEKCLQEEKEKSKEKPPKYNISALKQLQDMGFPKERAILALQENNDSVSDSIQWLFEHEGETIEVPPPPTSEVTKPKTSFLTRIEATDSESLGGGAMVGPSTVVGGAMGGPSRAVGGALGGALSETSLKSVRSMEQLSTPEKVKNMLESFRAFGRKGFKPDTEALQNLKEMGFEEVEIVEALRVNGNNKDLACEWLLGCRDISPAETEVTGCISEDSELFQAFVEDPQIQVGLNSTKCLIALLTILENPSRMQQWVKEPDVGPLLQNAWRIFTTHMDKQATQPLLLPHQQHHHTASGGTS